MDTGDYHLGERGFVLEEGLPLSGDGSACFGIDRFLVSFALLSRIINNSRIKLEPHCNTRVRAGGGGGGGLQSLPLNATFLV